MSVSRQAVSKWEGAQDKIVTPEAAEEIAAKPGCPIYMYENLAHAAYEEAKNFNKRVYDFFAKE